MNPKFNNFYGSRKRPTVKCGKTLTKQSFKDDCDINIILSRFVKNGSLPDTDGQMRFMDCASIPDFATLQNFNAALASEFAQTPSEARGGANTPQEWYLQRLDEIEAQRASQAVSPEITPPNGAAEDEPSAEAQLPS